MPKIRSWTKSIEAQLFEEAILIRRVEETVLDLFQLGLVNGTVHTCIGQEFSALAFCKQLKSRDFVFSNHRCHGHYIAFTGDYGGLIAEIMGKASGVCGGIGGSQHLCNQNFLSNGVQGGILPVSAGMALAAKLRDDGSMGVVFMGDGTLGEGAVYETFNLASKWKLPLLIVLENNLYAQSTSITRTLAGEILDRPQAFGITSFEDSTENYETLYEHAAESIQYVRTQRKPAFHLVNTYRLAPHSKSDEFRDSNEIEEYRAKDPIVLFSENQKNTYTEYVEEANVKIKSVIDILNNEKEQTLEEYTSEIIQTGHEEVEWRDREPSPSSERLIHKINQALHKLMEQNENVVLIGEDIEDPYGGAFKATQGISNLYPERIFTTPVSEAAITGLANGLALQGYRPIVEIMFGDFITLAMDQIINHASKFYHMYNKKVLCPMVVRMPMGGMRGYGPTHSQSLEKFILGIDNIKVIALNRFLSPLEIYQTICLEEKHPVIVTENKVEYTKKFASVDGGIFEKYSCEISSSRFPTLRFFPCTTLPDATFFAYGGAVSEAFHSAEILFREKEILVEIVIPSQLSPLPITDLQSSIHTEFVFTLEEGSACGGWGGEAIASLVERGHRLKAAKRIASIPVPIPAARKLERQTLINVDNIVSIVSETFYGN